MTAKDYFEEMKAKMQAIDFLVRRIREAEDDLTAIGGFDYTKPVVQSSPKNVMEEKVIELEDLLAELVAQKKQYQREYFKMERRLMQLSNAKFGQVIRLRFFGKKNRIALWGWVAEEMGYSEIRVKELYRDAMKEFEERFLQFDKTG